MQGLGQTRTVVDSDYATFTLRPVGQPSSVFLIDAFVLPKICEDLSTRKVAVDNWSRLRKNLSLADSDLGTPGPVHIYFVRKSLMILIIASPVVTPWSPCLLGTF